MYILEHMQLCAPHNVMPMHFMASIHLLFFIQIHVIVIREKQEPGVYGICENLVYLSLGSRFGDTFPHGSAITPPPNQNPW